MGSLTLRYNMFPLKHFAGHVEATVEPDGRIKYTLYPTPFDGVEESRTLVVDPANDEEMRAIRQLHLQPICEGPTQ